MADAPITFAQSYVQYGIEDSYAKEATTIDNPFGHDVSITIERRNNLIQSRSLGDRNVKKLLAGNFEGIATVEGMLANTHMLGAAFGSSLSTGTNPVTHSYPESDTLPSITIEEGSDLGTTDSVVKLLGCKLDEMSLTGAIGEPIRFRQVWFYKIETEGTSLDTTPAVDPETPFIYSQATVELPDATTLNRVQRLEWAIRNNLIRAYGLGSRFPSKIVPGPREYPFSFDKTFENSAMLEKVYGGGTGPASTIAETSLDINVTNGLSGANERHLQITMVGAKLDPYTNPKRPGEMIIETISGVARIGTGIGQDAEAAPPFTL